MVSGASNNIVTISIEMNLPSAGFIPKGVLIGLKIDFGGDEQTESEMVNLGESKTISLSFEMTSANADALGTTGIFVTSSAVVTPRITGQDISQGKQETDLGSQTIMA
ncbi:MAG: hypothetical protein IH840_11690 [Candidatus Heimdallarchaeota archaeon]|nr:hypothetical protein [Candidatus Heimdallarchaeota archaeon]